MSRKGPVRHRPGATRRTFERVARVAMGLIAVGAVVFGILMGWDSVARWWLARRVRTQYVQTECTVLQSRIAAEGTTKSVVHYGTGGHRHRARKPVTLYRPEVRYRYVVGSDVFESSRFSASALAHDTPGPVGAVLARYPVGAPCTCWYDPKQPQEAVLER